MCSMKAEGGQLNYEESQLYLRSTEHVQKNIYVMCSHKKKTMNDGKMLC